MTTKAAAPRMRVLVTGGRLFDDAAFVYSELDRLNRERGPFALLIHGGAPGVDLIADEWAADHGVQPVECRALWDYWEGKGRKKIAGAVRNRAMLWLKPHMVIAFPGGNGTADMLEASEEWKKRGETIEIMRIAAKVPA